jgi:hypothetical protein
MEEKRVPVVGDIWRHRNGNLYAVVGISNEHSERVEYPPRVEYANVENGRRWSRDLSDWHRSMVWTGRAKAKVRWQAGVGPGSARWEALMGGERVGFIVPWDDWFIGRTFYEHTGATFPAVAEAKAHVEASLALWLLRLQEEGTYGY